MITFRWSLFCFSVLDELKAEKWTAADGPSSIATNPLNSIVEMYPPVAVESLISDESQNEFHKRFIQSGEFEADPFEIAHIVKRPHVNCVAVSLFKQNVEDRVSGQFPVDEPTWDRRYWSSLKRIAAEMKSLPSWKLRIYVERQLWDLVVSEFSDHAQIELCCMRTNSVGASPGTLWRFLALSDCDLENVLVTDVDEPLLLKQNRMETFLQDHEYAISRNGGFSDLRQYLVDMTHSSAKNYATIIASFVMSRPERFDFEISKAMKGFMANRRKQNEKTRPWAYADHEQPSVYNQAIGSHSLGWGSHWFGYCFDERFLKHVVYYHFANQGQLHTFANTLALDEMSPEGICDYRYVTDRGNECVC